MSEKQSLFTKKDIFESVLSEMEKDRGVKYVGYEVGSPRTFLEAAIDVVIREHGIPYKDKVLQGNRMVQAFERKSVIDVLDNLAERGASLRQKKMKYGAFYPTTELIQKVKQKYLFNAGASRD